MKRIALLLIILFSQSLISSTSAGTKDANTRKLLDTTASHIQNAGGISLQFTATSLSGKVVQGTTTGQMDIMGKRFYMSTPDMQTWFDGRQQWSMQTDDDEVNLTEPTGTELQAVNPYAFLSIYKRGFNYKMKKDTLSNGKQGYKVWLNADNARQEIREMFLEIDNQYNPVRVSIRQGKKQWVRLVVNSFKTGQKFADSHFTFPKAKYPQAEIIDLR